MKHETKSIFGMAAIAAVCVIAAPATAAEPQPKPQAMVDALHTTFGEHHARAVHAKGIILQGTFTPDPAARTLSKAKLFTAGQVPVVVRFSDFTGIPNIPDNVGDANPRGFAVKFRVPGESDVDVVTHSFNGFPTKNSADFRDLLLSIAASAKATQKPTPLDNFLGGHPNAATFLTTQKSPESYATSAYFGVNAMKFTDIAGRVVFVRYRFMPAAGEHYLDPAALKAKGMDFLQPEITQRVAKGSVRFDWYAQIATKDDVIDDPSVAWPDARRLVKLGTVTIASVVADQSGEDRKLLFLPANLPDGMEAADPMLGVRNGAYPISFNGRQ